MIALSEDEQRMLVQGLDCLKMSLPLRGKQAKLFKQLRSRLMVYKDTDSILVENCGCEVLIKPIELVLNRCALHDSGIEAVKMLANIIDTVIVFNLHGDAVTVDQETIDDAAAFLDDLLEIPHTSRTLNEEDARRNYAAEIAAIEKG